MDAAGSLGQPIPFPKPVFSRPRSSPWIAAGLLEILLIDVSRPFTDAFTVRLYEEDHVPPEVDVVAAFLLYGAGLSDTASRLETIWQALMLVPVSSVRHRGYRSYDHPKGITEIVASIEALQQNFLP